MTENETARGDLLARAMNAESVLAQVRALVAVQAPAAVRDAAREALGATHITHDQVLSMAAAEAESHGDRGNEDAYIEPILSGLIRAGVPFDAESFVPVWLTAEEAQRGVAPAPVEVEPAAYEVSIRATGQHLGALCISPGEAENLSEVYELIPLYRHPARKIDREALIDIICQNAAETFVHEVGQGRMVTPDAIEAIADAVIAHLEGGAA